MSEPSVYFYGRLAGATKREAERAARDAGYRVASTLRDALDLVVLGEAESLSQLRIRLAQEFDARSREAFESGALELLSETEFFRRAARRVAETTSILNSPQTNDSEPLFSPLPEPDDSRVNTRQSNANASTISTGHTPAEVAELVGASLSSIRRWYRLGFLTATFERERLPRFSTREVLVAKRLAFLFSTGLTEEFVVKRLIAFAHTTYSPDCSFPEVTTLRDAKFDVGAIILMTTLSSDGCELLLLSPGGPTDWRGQRRFDFSAFPTDGTYETPETPTALSKDEEQILLAERLAAWNASETEVSGRPAFLSLFNSSPTEKESDEPSIEGQHASPELSQPEAQHANEFNVAETCERAWRLERDGYWEEAERLYRLAALKGGHEPNVCYRLGNILFLLGDYGAARERFYSVLELDSDRVDAKIALGKTFVALGELDAAFESFNDALKDRKHAPVLHIELGKLYLRLGKRKEAEFEFQLAIKQIDDPKLTDDIRRLLLTMVRRS